MDHHSRTSQFSAAAMLTALILFGTHSLSVTQAEPIEIKLGHVATIENPYHLGAQRFAEIVGERTNGAISVSIFPNAQLGNDRDLVEGLQLGTIQAAVVANAPLSSYSPQTLLFDLPFLFRDDEHWDKIVDGPIAEQITDQFLASGFRSVGTFDGGWRSPYNTERAITQLDDIRGLKFRTMESPMHISMYQALGAHGVPMASSEQYSAIEQGVVDGSDNPPSFYLQLRHYEVAKHYAAIPLFKLTVHLLVSEILFTSLSPEFQEILLQAGKEASAFNRQKSRDLDLKLREEMAGLGVLQSTLAEGELTKFVERMRDSVWKEYEGIVGKDTIEQVVSTR